MANDKALGLNYLGTIDDMVLRYPWRFKLTSSALNHALITQLIDGRPIVLNDGYLVNHPLARAALMDRKSLLWELIRIGFVRVMARGGDRYTLDEMPIRMGESITTFADLVHDQVENTKWSELRVALARTDEHLREQGHLMDWPPYDAGSGFTVLAQRLKDRKSTAQSLGLGRAMNTDVFHGFLNDFIERMQHDTTGARNHWEILAKKYATTNANATGKDAFIQALMRLGNEMYHYNMGIMLSAHHGMRVSVETQTSAAFDDLLLSQNIYLDELNAYPKLNVPAVIATASPVVLAAILERGRAVYEARQAWMLQRERWELAHASLHEKGISAVSLSIAADTREAGLRYARELSNILGEEIKYDKGEGFFNFAVGAALKEPAAGIVAFAGTTVAAGFASGNPQVAVAAGFAAGWVVSMAQKKMLGSVTKRFKVMLLEKQIVPPEVVRRSMRIVEKIKSRKMPSAIDIDPTLASELAAKMKRFGS